MKFKDWSIKNKLMIIGLGAPTVLALGIMALYFSQYKKQVIESYIDKARAVCMSAEATRGDMEEKWDAGLFKSEDLKSFVEAGQTDKALMTVPIVAAWKTAEKNAKSGNYEFKTPKFSPRSIKNTPDVLESRALKYMVDEDVEEYYEIDSSINSIRYFRSIKLSANCMQCHGNPSDSEKYWGRTDGKDVLGADMEGWKVGERHGAFEVIQSLDAADKAISSAMITAGTVVVGGLLAVIFAFMKVSNGIVNPIKRASERMKKFAEGDLSERITDINQKDEVGNLVESMNFTSEELSKSISELSDATGVLSASAEQLSANSSQMMGNVSQMDNKASSVADSANNVAETVNSTATNIEEMSATINEIAKNCTKASQVSNDANTKAIEAHEVMMRLGQSAKEINNVVEVISNIADQTNLLALNATIEAASAGESGKGFAVVANEVKELASQSAKAAEQIASQIEKMQQDTTKAISSIEAITKVNEEVKQISDTIAVAVEEQSATTNEVAKLMSSVSASTTQITNEIQDVSANAKESTNGAKENTAQSNELSKLADQLKGIVDKFKL